MDNNKMPNTKDIPVESHKAARPLKWFKDKDGNTWLCDRDIDPDGDLEAQGCWRCEEMAFPTGGR
jgi:hypothetical protein